MSASERATSGLRTGPKNRYGELSEEVLLLTPGPTQIHPRALAAMHWPMRGHMDPDVFAYNDEVVEWLRELYGSGADSFAALLSGTGSLAMEAGFCNLLEPGERVLVISNGVFGERMVEMATRVGADPSVLRFPLGSPVDPAAVRETARRVRPKVIAMVHGETSSGVLNSLPEVGEVAREVGALFAVDAVTTVGMLPFSMEEWGVDYAYTGSQKCLSAPPGLAPVAFSARAMEAIAARRSPVVSWYSDAIGMRNYWEPGTGGRKYHHTIPVQLHWATGEAIRAALDEGMINRARRAGELGASALEALASVGFGALVPLEHRLPTVLTLTLPSAINDAEVRQRLRSEYRISVAGGLAEMSGRIWRLGLMGENARPEHYLRLMEALAEILREPGLSGTFADTMATAA
jgi:alanine-glyoxylate transaminase/serine-glyoxylate transaminase/serine-pyruvate transaminase